MSRIVDTYNSNYPLIEGTPFTDYNADKEFLFQMEKHFPRLFKFEVLSRKGRGIRMDALLRGKFANDEFSQNTFFVYTLFFMKEEREGLMMMSCGHSLLLVHYGVQILQDIKQLQIFEMLLVN